MNSKQLIEILKGMVTEERYALLEKKLLQRTRHITLVLENVHHEQNISAVIRTCECLGIQDLHIIENSNKHGNHPTIDRGAEKWLTIRYYNSQDENSQECVEALKQDGYKIIATTPHDDATLLPPTPGFGAKYSLPERSDSLYRYEVKDEKIAIVIGSERKGISQYIVDNSDDFVTIPMVGFTESLNLSACAAIIASYLRHSMEKGGIDISIDEDDRDDIMIEWLKNSIRNADLVMQRIIEQNI